MQACGHVPLRLASIMSVECKTSTSGFPARARQHRLPEKTLWAIRSPFRTRAGTNTDLAKDGAEIGIWGCAPSSRAAVVSCLSSQGLSKPNFNSSSARQGLVALKDQPWIPKEGDGVVKPIKPSCPALLVRGWSLVPEVSSASEAPGPC